VWSRRNPASKTATATARPFVSVFVNGASHNERIGEQPENPGLAADRRDGFP
jgi:hypothetical protein